MAHKGHCFCGQVHYEIDEEPLHAVTCWCRDCQYIAAGSATNNVLFPEESVRFEGEITEIEKISDSGNTVRRGFCPKCGSQIYSRTLGKPGVPIRIRTGTLDDVERFAPRAVIWVASAPSWAQINPDLPHFEGQPPMPAAEKQ